MGCVFTGTVPGSERAQCSVVATKGSCVVRLVWSDKIRASEEVWSDCYKGQEQEEQFTHLGIRGSGGFGGEPSV